MHPGAVHRFLSEYRRPGRRVREVEARVDTAGGAVGASLYLPQRPPAPAWVVLHGITVPGRRHAALIRFARALSAAGNTVLVPEIPDWQALRLRPAATAETLAAGAAFLAGRAEALPGAVGVVGFSVGATQALIAAAEPTIRPLVRRVVGFGGYCDPRRTLAFMCTGDFTWRGRLRSLAPDPYGRWIFAANYLTGVPGCERFEAAAEGLRELAMEAGRRGVNAADPLFDPLKATLRRGLPAAQREAWDLLAPPAAHQPADRSAARELADRLATAALAANPALDPRPALPALQADVVLSHGRADRLIPFPETLDLYRALPARARPFASVTGLFAHSAGADALSAFRYAAEGVRFLRLLNRAVVLR